MKKLMTMAAILISALVLLGCATDHYPTYVQQAQKTDMGNRQIISTYFASQAARDSVVMTNIKDPSALILYAMLQGQRDAVLVTQFKGSVIKAPTTGMDLWNTALGNTVPTLIRWGAGYLMAGDLLDALGGGMSVGGDYISSTNNVSSGGGDLDFSNSFDYSKTVTTTSTDGSFNGDYRDYPTTTTNY